MVLFAKMRRSFLPSAFSILALASCGGWQAVDTYDDMRAERFGPEESGDDASSAGEGQRFAIEVTGSYRCDEWGGYFRPREYPDELWCLSQDAMLCRRYVEEHRKLGDELVMYARISGVMGGLLQDSETAGCDRRFEVRLIHEVRTGRRLVD